MSNHYVLHYHVQGTPAPLPWSTDLTAYRTVVLRATRQSEALAIMRAYSLTMVLVDMEQWNEAALEAIQTLRAAGDAARRPPLVGLHRFDLDAVQRAALIESGFDSLLAHNDPERSLLWPLETLVRLGDLTQFEASQMDVHKLAHETREVLHELSQPLSAVQGRLQLMAAKAAQDDPNGAIYKDLVRLVFDISHQVMEIQRLHRNYS